MTITKYTFTWIFSGLSLLLLSVIIGHFFVVKSAQLHLAEKQLQSQAYLSEAVLNNAFSRFTTLTPDNIKQQLTSLAQSQPETTFELVLASTGKTFVQHPIEQNTTSSWVSSIAKFDTLETSRTLYKNQSPIATVRLTLSSSPLQSQIGQQLLLFTYIAFVIYLFIMIPLLLILKRKLRPISVIADHYNTITSNQFSSPLPLPQDTECRAITKMINHLTTQLEANFKRQATEAIKLKEQAYRDNVSGLGNRHFFINQLSSWLSSSSKGGLILLKSTLIDDIYRRTGFEMGDSFVRSLAEELNANIIHSEITLARLSYDEFAVLAPNITASKLKSISETMHTVHTELQLQRQVELPDSVCLGMLMVSNPSSASQLLAQLDNVLAQAARTPDHPFALVDDSQQPDAIAFGKQQWKSLLLDAIDHNLIQYQYQPVADDTQAIYHHEVFSAICKDKQHYGANQFLGAIEDVGAGVLFDRHVIAHHINLLNANPRQGPIAINITANSVSDPAFIRWLTQIMDRNQRLSSRLFIEIPETSFVRTPDSCGLLCSAIRFYKFRFGVDNYGRYLKSLDYLKEFRPDYVKIDFSYTHQLNDQMKINLLSSISRTAHSLDIMTIATRVETETQLDRLADLFVSGFQGYIIEKMQPNAVKRHHSPFSI
ncbi:EAL domain-containing protein [Photobacterium nomapromontoriensis]|uniref:EAL domain-containing protein n=1 Tax=Photobacterium nomapromontoriensis TaxID=2910237 RepID=UPI003D0F3812